jgi:hypothetical protein
MTSFTIIDESFRQLNKHQQRLNNNNNNNRVACMNGLNGNNNNNVRNLSNYNQQQNDASMSHLRSSSNTAHQPTGTGTCSENELLQDSNTKSNRPLLPSENRAANLSYAEISQYFSLPMHEAIVQLKVDETSLKKRCRMLGISRWPYRKRMNLLNNKKRNDTSSNAENSSLDTEDAEKKKKNSLFKCFQVFKLQKKEPPAPKLSEEEHALKQNMMQREYNSRFEPVESTRERVKRGEYWRNQPNSTVYSSGTISSNSNSSNMNNGMINHNGSGCARDNNMLSAYDPMSMSPAPSSPHPVQYQKYSYEKSFSQPGKQSLPMQQQSYYQNVPQSQFASNTYKTNEADYYGYSEPQQYPYPVRQQHYILNQKQERLPSIHDLLDPKKRIRRESADRAMQEQFATPMKRFNHSPPYHTPLNTDYHYQAQSNPHFSSNNQPMQRIYYH